MGLAVERVTSEPGGFSKCSVRVITRQNLGVDLGKKLLIEEDSLPMSLEGRANYSFRQIRFQSVCIGVHPWPFYEFPSHRKNLRNTRQN